MEEKQSFTLRLTPNDTARFDAAYEREQERTKPPQRITRTAFAVYLLLRGLEDEEHGA